MTGGGARLAGLDETKINLEKNDVFSSKDGGCPWLTTLDKIKININNMGVCPWSVQPLTLGPVAPDPPSHSKKGIHPF